MASASAFPAPHTSLGFPKRAAICDGSALYAALREDGVVVVDTPLVDADGGDLSHRGGATVKQTLAALGSARRFFELPRAAKLELVGPTHRLGYAPALAEVRGLQPSHACSKTNQIIHSYATLCSIVWQLSPYIARSFQTKHALHCHGTYHGCEPNNDQHTHIRTHPHRTTLRSRGTRQSPTTQWKN